MNSKFYLKIFQLEAYRPSRFIPWLLAHHWRPFLQAKDEPVWTPKATLLYRLSWFSAVLLLALALRVSFAFTLLLAVVLFTNSYIPLLIAWCLIRPYELINRVRVKHLIRQKVLGLKDLEVIGITGSYGKTSTKMVLEQLLPKCLMTPKSFNTLFGIWKVVDYELCSRYRFFICEMGAYKRGDVKEFCELTVPHVGILTGINEQHLERFGSIENTKLAKFEITQNLRAGARAIVNLDNAHIRENLHLSNVPLIGYCVDAQYAKDERSAAQCEYVVSIDHWRIEGIRMHFVINYKDEQLEASTSLIGKAHLSNILAAFTTATMLEQPVAAVISKITHLQQVPNRLECKQSAGYILLDNSYSSNPDGFRDSIDALSRFSGHKVLITPGLVELGADTERVHRQLGQLAAEVCDEIVLVGDSDKTKALRKGIEATAFDTSKVQVLGTRTAMLEFLQSKAHSGEVVLIENDLPDQYL